ncbi:GSCFA domain-containing protein [Ferruginibacter sp. SUN106]|uniref:GSCFA domain-containing protein n=1 Tax=Ferruginibacter sp. SUN106 TaxID=2978348 RepID=UPI003D36AC6C
MNFHLEFSPKQLLQKINHQHKLLLVGSCFTENIGDKLVAHKFSVLQNPNGILFNPVSVKEALENYIVNKIIKEEDLFYLNEAYHSWQHHSRFSGITKEEAVNKINASTNVAHSYLKKTDFVVITLGSAWVYELSEKAANAKQGAVAANNHKAPADWFNRRLLSNAEVTELLNEMIKQLQNFNPSIKVIFTISPVRHLREGFVENNRSKAALINAVHLVTETFADVFYFPAYELVIDDLRDYRFFAEDMVHPNYAATNYVWEKFVACCIDETTQELMIAINEINAAISHKPFNSTSEAHKKFQQTNLTKIKNLQNKHPYLSFAKEEEYFNPKQI